MLVTTIIMRARKTYATHFVRAGMSAEENKHARRVSSAVAARRRLRGRQACGREARRRMACRREARRREA